MITGVVGAGHDDFNHYCGHNSCRHIKCLRHKWTGESAHSGGGVAVSFARFDGWRWIGGCRMLERGEGRPTSLRPADWVTELRDPGSVCDQQQKVLGTTATSALLPSLLRLSPSLERGRRSERRIIGAARSVSTGEPLAWCSVQPASLCGRAAHASAEAPKQPGLGVASDFPLKPWEKNVLRIYGQQHPCQPRRAPRKRIPAEEHHRLGTVARRRLSATSSLTGPRGDWWLRALLLRQATMLRTSTLATRLLFLGLLHSLQVIAPGWAIDGELIESCAERSVCVCVCLQVTNVDRRNVEEMKHITVAFCSCPQSVRATYEY